MPKILYQPKNFRADYLLMIRQANVIITEYADQDFNLTLRQLYYQFVARGLLANNQANYKKLGNVVNDARLAGLIDWNAIEDRTRNLERISFWDSPAEIVNICSRTFQLDLWKDQDYRVEVWIEKEALAGVFERICTELRVPYLSCRGYTSQSEMWRASQRMLGYFANNQTPLILHFGDHDPSGIDMSRDIVDRLRMFTKLRCLDLKRLALNMDQVEDHSPPPNPAKLTDTRSTAYIAEHGDESWELDALDPAVLSGLVRDAVMAVRDEGKWQARLEEENEARRLLTEVSDKWEEITEGL